MNSNMVNETWKLFGEQIIKIIEENTANNIKKKTTMYD